MYLFGETKVLAFDDCSNAVKIRKKLAASLEEQKTFYTVIIKHLSNAQNNQRCPGAGRIVARENGAERKDISFQADRVVKGAIQCLELFARVGRRRVFRFRCNVRVAVKVAVEMIGGPNPFVPR